MRGMESTINALTAVKKTKRPPLTISAERKTIAKVEIDRKDTKLAEPRGGRLIDDYVAVAPEESAPVAIAASPALNIQKPKNTNLKGNKG